MKFSQFIYLCTIYAPFQIIIFWFDYILFYLFTANLQLLIFLISSNGWKPLNIFPKSYLLIGSAYVSKKLTIFLHGLMLLTYICLLKVRNIEKLHIWYWENDYLLGRQCLNLNWNVREYCNLITTILKTNFYSNWIKSSRGVFRTRLNTIVKLFCKNN